MDTKIELNSPEWRNLQMTLQKSVGPRHKQVSIKVFNNGMKQYSCMVCPMKYNDRERMEHHLCMHNDEYRYICDICGTGLKRKEHLDRHTLEHEEVRPHICLDCGKGFKRKEHLNIHTAIHNNHKAEVCHICHRSFNRKDHLNNHMSIHVRRDPSMEVDHENIPIKQEADFVDDNLSIPIQGEDEKETFVKLLGLSPTVPVNPLRPFQCVLCFKTYKRKDHLKLHLYTHQRKDKICGICDKAFYKEEQLQAHVRLDHQLVAERALVMQDNNENKGTLHECPHCQKKFTRKTNLRAHIMNNHKNLQCGQCSKELSEYEIATHNCDYVPIKDEFIYENEDIIIKPEIEITVMEDDNLLVPRDSVEYTTDFHKWYKCDVCSKRFRRKDHYKIHLHIHTGIKSFFCPDCGKGFYRKDHLQKHSQVHFKKPKTDIPVPVVTKTVKKPIPALKPLPALKPIKSVTKTPTDEPVPEITIRAPSSKSLNALQIKVPYKVVTSNKNGQIQSRTVTPQNNTVLKS